MSAKSGNEYSEADITATRASFEGRRTLAEMRASIGEERHVEEPAPPRNKRKPPRGLRDEDLDMSSEAPVAVNAEGCKRPVEEGQWQISPDENDSLREVWRSKRYLEHPVEGGWNPSRGEMSAAASEDPVAECGKLGMGEDANGEVKAESDADLDLLQMSDDAVAWLKNHIFCEEETKVTVCQDRVLFEKLRDHLPDTIISWYLEHERLYAEYLASDMSVLQDFDYACIHYAMSVFDASKERAEHFCDVLNWCLDTGFSEGDAYRVAEGFLTVATGSTLDIDFETENENENEASVGDSEDEGWLDEDDEDEALPALEQKEEKAADMGEAAGIRRRKKRIGRFKKGK